MMTRKQALDLFADPDLIGIGMAADAVRRRLHPEGVVTYIIDRNINYTNFCTEYCTFCAFYRPLGHEEGYVLAKEVIFEKIQETLELGGTGVLMQGGLHPDLKIEWYEDLLRSIKERFPRIQLHCFSSPEILNIAEVSGLSPARHHRAVARRGPGFDSRRRRRDPGRRRAAAHQPPEVHDRRVDGGASRRSRAGHANHGHHDVRLRRDHRAADESPGSGPPAPGRDRRLHGLHPVDLPAREHLRSAT